MTIHAEISLAFSAVVNDVEISILRKDLRYYKGSLRRHIVIICLLNGQFVEANDQSLHYSQIVTYKFSQVIGKFKFNSTQRHE